MNTVKLTHDKLSVDDATNVATSPSCGAISIFVGTTRDNFEDKKVIQLEYEAYQSMAEKVMLELCNDIRSKWTVENIVIYHRLGVVPVCEASVIIAISSEHRVESLAAVQHAIHSLKASVPIWKKEVYDDASGSNSQWKENRESETVPVFSSEVEISSIEREQTNFVSSNLIQIKAKPEEVRRRIESFISRKREEVNRINIRDFCTRHWQDGNVILYEGADSCARVDAVLVPRKDSKSHLRVRRVLNTTGPQTTGIDPGSMSSISQVKLEPSTDTESPTANVPTGIAERLLNIESHLKIQNLDGPVPPDIYARLKKAEERILYLESMSPEYFTTLPLQKTETNTSPCHPQAKKKKVYSAEELLKKIQELENS